LKPHLLRVDAPPETFAPLITAARALALRVGWLELAAEQAPGPLPPSLGAAAGAGVLRAVALGGGTSVAVKALRGAPVPRDVLREHFAGCALVLVRGDLDVPRLAADGEAWRVTLDDVSRPFSSEALARALRSRHAFDLEPEAI
jgi:hypothetical protein